jgi:hypothetical protein
VQFLEVHHEEVRDLLGDPSPGTPARPAGGLPLRDSAVGGATASGLATRRVETAEDALAQQRHGAAVRATGNWEVFRVVPARPMQLSTDNASDIASHTRGSLPQMVQHVASDWRQLCKLHCAAYNTPLFPRLPACAAVANPQAARPCMRPAVAPKPCSRCCCGNELGFTPPQTLKPTLLQAARP